MYKGRFAPSPSGPLHLGSISTAIASYLDAKSNQGLWLLRIDDIDSTRTTSHFTKMILKQLDDLHLHWDETIQYQSKRLEHYRHYLHSLNEVKCTYICNCSRKKISQQGELGIDGYIYPGTCRLKSNLMPRNNSIRIITLDEMIKFEDKVQGSVQQNILKHCGDFIINRSDEIFAYQFCVVIDDYLDKITNVIRGSDLLESTPRQIYIHKKLKFDIPDYGHIPILNFKNKKLSKGNGDHLDIDNDAQKIWLTCLKFLNQRLPNRDLSLEEIIQHAIEYWDIKKLKKIKSIDVDEHIQT